MAAFAILSNSKEKNIDSYKEFIERLQREAKLELADKPPATPASSFQYHLAREKRGTQYVFKDFIYHLSMKMFEGGAGILLCENPSPTLKFFVRHIEQTTLPDGNTANAYYGEIRRIVTAFMNYFTTIIDDTAKKLNKHTHFLTNDLFVELIDETEDIYDINYRTFLRQYQPLNSEIEKARYRKVRAAREFFLDELQEIRDAWEFRQDQFEDFAKKMFEASLKKTSDLCNFTHCYISMMLADRLYEIAVSLEETASRLKCNLEQCKENCQSRKTNLIIKLYEKNKEYLDIHRRLYRASVDSAEVNRAMNVLREKIGHCGNEETLAMLEVENLFWIKRLKDFTKISTILIGIQKELQNLEEDRKTYKSIRCLELPGTKTLCFELMGENIDSKIADFKDKRLKMARAILTFFCVRGTDRIMYTDRAGSFHIDEYNHQNYITKYGFKYFHVNCYGDFVENTQDTPYYYDDNGRYTFDEDGEKIYQIAPCTSQYKLGEDGLLKKITEDCGHSFKANSECRLEEIKDLTDKEILPRNEPLDITGTLDSETVKYLWDSFGMVLSEVLYEVATNKPKNPIHAMARLLIKRKFEASAAELRNWKKDAQKYRKDIQKKRKNEAMKERLAWQAKQIKQSKFEQCDDSLERTTHQYLADIQRAYILPYYDN